jgi:hypothetical protein
MAQQHPVAMMGAVTRVRDSSLAAASRRKIADRIGPERLARINLARALVAKRRYILLASHMRSYSTLLGHLLGSHPQIAGYAEQHQSYRSFADLSGLCYGVWKVSDFDVSGDYLFDKILHDKHVIADEVLQREDVLPIYAIREPVSSLRSIVATGRRKNKASWQEPESASVHLFKRYAAVRDLAARRPDAAALFTDSVVTDPERTLAGLGGYLGLTAPIRPEYGLFPKTGVGGFGDPIGPIDAGRIVTDRTPHDVDVPAELAARLTDDYRRTCDVLLSTCATVLGEPVATTSG